MITMVIVLIMVAIQGSKQIVKFIRHGVPSVEYVRKLISLVVVTIWMEIRVTDSTCRRLRQTPVDPKTIPVFPVMPEIDAFPIVVVRVVYYR
jgi:CheY-like chemotaxis protein